MTIISYISIAVATIYTSSGDRLERCLTGVRYWMSANRLKLNAQKTELLWAGSRHHAAVLGSNGPSLRLDDETVVPRDHVRLLGVFFSSDLSIDKHVTTVSAACFYSLGQLRRVRRSLDADCAVGCCTEMLVHAFIMSRVDYCNAVFAWSAHNRHFTTCTECGSASSPVPSTTADCQQCPTTNSPGSMSVSEWSTSCLSWCAGVWRTKLQGT